jgi:hypothetical protein
METIAIPAPIPIEGPCNPCLAFEEGIFWLL